MQAPTEAVDYLVQGATYRSSFTLPGSGSLSGYLARAQIRNRPADDSSSATLATCTATITDATNRVVEVVATAAQTQAINWATYGSTLYMQIEVYTASDADVQRPLNVTLVFLPEVTR